jgi:hypothetical protein
MSDEGFTIAHGEWLHILPVCHYRAEFAGLARDAVRYLGPSVVAVELPASLRNEVLRGVARLPELSVVVCPVDSDGMVYLTIEPVDPMVEALRSASEMGVPVAFVDLDVESYGEYRDAVPDAYAVGRVGLEAFYQTYRRFPRPRDPLDQRREAAMAYHLQRLHQDHGGPVLLVCGMAHVDGVREQVVQPQGIPLVRPRRPGVMVLNLHPRCLAEVLAEAPGVQAVYEILRTGVPEPEPEATPAASRRVGPFRILDGASAQAEEQRITVLRDVARRSGAPLDRLRLQRAVFDSAVARWERVTGEALRTWQRDIFARYSRNLALLGGRLVVDAYDFLVAVRGIGDENLVYEAYELLTAYPWQKEVTDLPSVEMSAEELALESRRIRIRPRFHRPKRRPFALRARRPKERYPGEWLEGFDEDGFCSYPPEDLVIEGYAQFLRKKGKALISEESARVEPFRSSLLDGIDMRETLRHWASERRIYVRESGRVPGDVGSTEGVQGPGISRCEYGGFMMNYPPRRLLEVWTDPDYRSARTKAEVLLLAALDYSLDRFIVHVAARPPRSFFKTLAERLDRKIIHIPAGQLSPESLRRLRVFHILAGRSKRQIARDYVW